MSDKMFQILVAAIPIRDGEVLVLQRSLSEKFMPGVWGLPCGKINFGEDLRDAVLRELREEAGIDGEVRRMVGYSTFLSTRNEARLHNLQVNFEIVVAAGAITMDHSNQDYRWISLAAVGDSDLDDYTKSTIAQALG